MATKLAAQFETTILKEEASKKGGHAQTSPGILSRVGNIISLAHLITESNIKAYVQPVVLFAILSVASGGVTDNPDPSIVEIAKAFPRAAIYIWLYVFHFDLSNQKSPDSIEEDRQNKPWRAIPSGRMSVQQAERWYVISTVLLLSVSALWLGGFPEALAFMAETWVYDYAAGASSWWAKNIINALFYSTGQLGATRVAAQVGGDMTRAGFEWCGLLCLMTLTTVQIQDLRDVEGDGARGRNTMPLAVGDGLCRWITALFIWFWSFACPAYWSDGRFSFGYVLPVVIGSMVAVRVLALRDVKSDRMSFHYHTLLWLPALYSVPLLSKYTLLP